MAIWPASISVEVITPPDVSPECILVGIDFRLGVREYFSALLGLTDSRGCLSVTRDQLMRDFDEDRQLFPMDYKVDLSECDSALIGITDGNDFPERRKSILESPLLSKRARDLWTRSRNPGLWATPVIVATDGEPVQVSLSAHHRGLP